MTDADLPHDEPPREQQGWLFDPLSDADARRQKRLGRGLAALLHLPGAEEESAPEAAPAAFAPGSVIQLSSCAEDEGDVPLEPAVAPPPVARAEPPMAVDAAREPEDEPEPEPPPDAPGQTYLLDDEVVGFSLPDVEME